MHAMSLLPRVCFAWFEKYRDADCFFVCFLRIDGILVDLIAYLFQRRRIIHTDVCRATLLRVTRVENSYLVFVTW